MELKPIYIFIDKEIIIYCLDENNKLIILSSNSDYKISYIDKINFSKNNDNIFYTNNPKKFSYKDLLFELRRSFSPEIDFNMIRYNKNKLIQSIYIYIWLNIY